MHQNVVQIDCGFAAKKNNFAFLKKCLSAGIPQDLTNSYSFSGQREEKHDCVCCPAAGEGAAAPR